MEGYKGVELQSLESDEDKNKELLNKRLSFYINYCQKCAPFPFNILGKTKETETLAIVVGLLLHEGILK